MSLLIRDLLQMAEQRFELEGCSDPKLDAELLLCYYLQKDRSYLFLHYGDEMEDRHCQGFLELCDRRASGVPLQYITGVQGFMGLEFKVNESVLIPRQDTELLVESALEELVNRKAPLGGFEILDLCTGSGAVGISLYKQAERFRIKTKITASDISKEALSVARENAGRNGAEKLCFVQGDLFEPFPKDRKGRGKKRFDLIVSNPPYIPSAVIPTLQREVKDHEPVLALDGGTQGLDFYSRILPESRAYLKPGGALLLEIGHNQGEALVSMAGEDEFWQPAEIRRDLNGKDRVCILRPVQEKF